MSEEAGRRLRRYVEERMAAAGYPSYAALYRRARVGRDTFQVWLRGDHAPSHDAGGRLAEALGVTYEDLIRARDGRPLAPPDETRAMVQEAADLAVRKLWAEIEAHGAPVPRGRRRSSPPKAPSE